jgi:hypothetical protein
VEKRKGKRVERKEEDERAVVKEEGREEEGKEYKGNKRGRRGETEEEGREFYKITATLTALKTNQYYNSDK